MTALEVRATFFVIGPYLVVIDWPAESLEAATTRARDLAANPEPWVSLSGPERSISIPTAHIERVDVTPLGPREKFNANPRIDGLV
jgi:hypothetical protein